MKHFSLSDNCGFFFCHNCILRVEQTNEEIDKADPEQPNWLIAGELIERLF
jgi:hypothetical protein